MGDIDYKIQCWYKDGCNMRMENCEKTCHRYLQMNYLINNCGMKNATRYLKSIQPDKVDIKAFMRLQEIKDNIVQYVSCGRNLFIQSDNLQTGKTTWSLKILYKFFDEIWAGNGFVVRGYFVHVPELMMKLKSFDYKNTIEFKELDYALKKADLVIWDDITGIDLTPQDQNTLNMYIDRRMIEGRANIFNGMKQDFNVVTRQLGQKLSARLQASEIITLQGKSYIQ